MRKFFISQIFFVLLLTVFIYPSSVRGDTAAPKMWGIAMGVRSAQIPFKTEIDTVNDLIPMMFYETDRFFLHGLTAGYRLYVQSTWEVSALARYRFFDIPAEYQNKIMGNALDFGGQFKYRFTPKFHLDFEVLSEDHGRIHANTVAKYFYDGGSLEFTPYARLRWKSERFNNAYYGLEIEEPGSGFDIMFGADIRYHLYSNLYVFGRARMTLLDSDTRDLEVIDESTQSELFLGLGFFNDKKKPRAKSLKSKPYIRVAYGWATPSSMGDIFRGDTVKDDYGNKLTSLFYGIPVADELFGLPISTYFTPGLVYHHKSSVQDNFTEYVAALKLYYTIPWPIRWRLGAAEGLSYSTQINYVEGTEMERKGYEPSKLMNFIDLTLDLNIGDLIRVDALKELWLGYSLHHRSSIFQKSSAFGRIKGGSNYNTVYLQYHW